MRIWVLLALCSFFLLAFGSSSITRKPLVAKNEIVLLSALKEKAARRNLNPIQKFLLLLVLEGSKRDAAHNRQKKGFLSKFSDGMANWATGFLNASMITADQLKATFERGTRSAERKLNTISVSDVDFSRNSSLTKLRSQRQTKNTTEDQKNSTDAGQTGNTTTNGTTSGGNQSDSSKRVNKIRNPNFYKITLPFAAVMCIFILLLCFLLKPTGACCDKFLKKPGELTRRQKLMAEKRKNDEESRKRKQFDKKHSQEDKRRAKIHNTQNKVLERMRAVALKAESVKRNELIREQKQRKAKEKKQKQAEEQNRKKLETQRKKRDAELRKQIVEKGKQLQKEMEEEEKNRREMEKARQEKEKQRREKQKEFEKARQEFIRQEKEKLEKEKLERQKEK